jgi:Uma2 family endonuclease
MSTAARVAPESVRPAPPALARPLYRFTVEQYERMIAADVFRSTDRVELLEGWIFETMTRHPPHDSAISRINRRLLRVLPDEWLLRVQSGIALRDSEPEPDLAIVRGPEEAYDRRKPVARDIALVIEVSESSLVEDREYKGPLYAQARIPEYWVVNLVESQIEVYTQPRAGRSPGYRRRQDWKAHDKLPLTLDGRTITQLPVCDLLPH